MCYLYFFCLHCYLINIHIFDYPDSLLSGRFTEVPTSPDNRGSTVAIFPGGVRKFWKFRRGGGGGINFGANFGKSRGEGGYTANPFRGGYGYFLEPHQLSDSTESKPLEK